MKRMRFCLQEKIRGREMRYLLIIFGLLVCISCTKKNWKVVFDKKEIHPYPYIEVNIKELKKNYKEYDGKWLKVTGGFVNMRFETSILQPKLKDDFRTSDIWVWYPDHENPNDVEFNNVNLERINRKEVILKGYFTTKDHGHLGMYPGVLQDITYIAVRE